MQKIKAGMSGSKNRISRKQQLEQVKGEALGAYLTHPEHDAIEALIDEAVSEYGWRLSRAIEAFEVELVAEIDAAAQRWGRGLVRAALEEVGLPDFDTPLFYPPEFMEHERGWDNPGADYEQALIRTTATITRNREDSLKAKFDERGNYVGVVEADGSGAPYRFLVRGPQT
jgi:hypothetical protein